LKVKLVIGFIYQDEAIFIKAKEKLSKKFGKIDFESASLDFNYTDYYEAEMGKGLKRKFISFSKPISIADLYRVKLYTNRLETKFLIGAQNALRLSADASVADHLGKKPRALARGDSLAKSRQVNIDPGYLDLAKLVLATTKDYAHRIFLRKGIFAEITLSFRGNSFSANEWAYPDYRSKEYIDIFNQIRKLFTS